MLPCFSELRCSRGGAGVCGGVCPKQGNVQPRVANAKTMSPDLDRSGTNKLRAKDTASCLLPVRASKAFIQALMLGFPIASAGFKRTANPAPLDSQPPQFISRTPLI